MAHKWVETKENVEYFLAEKHLQSKGWDAPPIKFYPYISDSEVYKSKKELPGKHFQVTSLIHGTTPPAAVKIIGDGGMKPTVKQLNGENLHLIWWGLALEQGEIDGYESNILSAQSTVGERRFDKQESDSVDHLTGSMDALSVGDVSQYICNSAPFLSTSRYGNMLFKYSIEELIQNYKTQFCRGEQPDFRILGTFSYRSEVMHAILVCPRAATFRNFVFPAVDEKGSVIFEKEGNWNWIPETTGGTMPGGEYRRWEHATFAFLVPEGHVFQLRDLPNHMHYCQAAEEAVFRMHTWDRKDRKDRRRWSKDEVGDYFKGLNIEHPKF